MKSDNPLDTLISPALLAELQAMAVAERRSARDMLHEAVEHYLHDRRAPPPKPTAVEAAERILARRTRHPLPEGMSIRDMQTFGRA